MGFLLNGTVITQSGTDTSLAGLSGNGATVTDFGAYKVYNCGGNRLVVNGTLTINGLDKIQEQLLIGTGSQSVIDIEVAGTLTIGFNSSNVDGSYINTQHFPSVVEKDVNLDFGTSRAKNDAWASTTRPFMLIKAGANLTWNGNLISCGGIGFDGNSNASATDSVIVFNDAIWDTRTVNGAYGTFDQLIYSYTRDININGFTVMANNDKSNTSLFGQLATPFYPIKGYTGLFTGAAFSGSTSQPVGYSLVIEDYAGIVGNDTADDIQPQGRQDVSTGIVTFLNSSKGSNLSIGPDQTDSIQLIKAEQSVSGNFKTSLGDNIDDFIVGTVDNNNTLYSGLGAAGIYDMGNILLAKWDGGLGVAIPTKTSYSPGGADADLYDFYMYAYLYQSRNRLQVLLREVGGQNLEFIGAYDTSITEPNRTLVDAYTIVNTLDRLYDSAKSNKIDNILIPSMDKPQIEAQGNILDLGDLDLDIGISGAAYVCTTTKITIKVR
jgi:hypothetical protein